MAASLGAGLWGIEHAIEPPPEARGDASEGAAGAPLPSSLQDATARLKQSALARAILGAPFVDHYVRTREWEIRQYEKAVTDWELDATSRASELAGAPLCGTCPQRTSRCGGHGRGNAAQRQRVTCQFFLPRRSRMLAPCKRSSV